MLKMKLKPINKKPELTKKIILAILVVMGFLFFYKTFFYNKSEPDLTRQKKGEVIYIKNCANCHQRGGNTLHQPSLDSMATLLSYDKSRINKIKSDSIHVEYMKLINKQEYKNLELYIKNYSLIIP